MLKYISTFRLVLGCLLVARKENSTGFSTGLTGRSKNLDQTGNPTGFHLWAQQRRWNTASPHSSTTTSTAVAYAGFWKGGGRGQKLQKIWEEHRSEFEIVTLKFRPILRPKSGEEQKKKRSSPKFRPIFRPKSVKFRAQNLMPNLQSKGGPCLNFAHFSMQFSNPGDLKGGPWPDAPPLNTPLIDGTHLATATGTYRPRLPVLICSRPFVMLQNWEIQGCQL